MASSGDAAEPDGRSVMGMQATMQEAKDGDSAGPPAAIGPMPDLMEAARSTSALGSGATEPERIGAGATWILAQGPAAALAGEAAAGATAGAVVAPAAGIGLGTGAGILLGVGAAVAAAAGQQERDKTAPKVIAVSVDAPLTSTHEAIPFTVTFDEALTGTVGTQNFSATNGTVSSVTRVGDSNAYRVVITPDTGIDNGQVALSLIGTGLADAAGNGVANADLSALARQAIDTLAPTLAISSDAATLSAGQSAQITFSFSEDPGTSFGTDDVLVTRGTLGPISGSGLIRTATFTPQTDQTDVSASLTVAAGRYTDAAGNRGAAASGPAIGLETRTEANIILQDGYLHGAELWVDMNDNGVIDADDFRVGESVDGVVQGYLTAQHQQHALIATGGIDISTGLRFQGSYSATPGSAVVNPLTTLVQSMVKSSVTLTDDLSQSQRQTLLQEARDAAMAKVSEALGLPAGADLSRIDTIATATTGTDAASLGLSLQQALEINSKALMVANMMAVGAAALKGATSGPGAPSMDTLAGFVVSGIVQAINTATSAGQALALGDADSLNTILSNAGEAARAGDVTMDQDKLAEASNSVSTAVASTNSLIDTLTGNAKANAQSNPESATGALVQILAAQKAAMDQIEDIKTGNSSTLSDLLVNFGDPAAALNQSLLVGSVRLGAAQPVPAPTTLTPDSQAPSVIAVSVAPERPGDLAQFVVTMSEGVLVRFNASERPTLRIKNTDSSTAEATFEPGLSGGDKLVFTYRVQEGDTRLDLPGDAQIALPNGASIRDLGGNDAELDLSQAIAGFSAQAVDTEAPSLTISAAQNFVQAGSDTLLTFAVSKKVSSLAVGAFTASDITVKEAGQEVTGRISEFRLLTDNLGAPLLRDGQTIYTARLTPGSNSAPSEVSVSNSRFTDVAGNANVASNTVVVGRQAIEAAVNISAEKSVFNLADSTGQASTTLHFRLSQASTSFDKDDVSITGGGTLTEFTGAGTDYSAKLSGITSSTQVLVSAGRFTATAGGVGNLPSNTLNFQADFIAPTVSIVVTNSAGGHIDTLNPGETAKVQFTLSEEAVGFGPQAVRVVGGFLSEFKPDAQVSTQWSAVFNPASVDAKASVWPVAQIQVDAGRFTDRAGNTNAAATAVRIDRLDPTVTLSSNRAALKIGETATIRFDFSEDPRGTFSASDVQVVGGSLGAISGTGLTRTAVFTPSAGLSGQSTLAIKPDAYSDWAGNWGSTGEALALAIDTLAPRVSSVTESTTAAITKDAISFTVTFSEALTGTVGPGNFTATNGSVTSVTQVGASNAYTVLVTPTAGLASGTVALSLVGTGLADAAGNALADTDLSSLASQAIDTLAPVADFSAIKNTLGQSLSAGPTNSASLELSGSNEAGASVSVYNASTLLGQATVIGTGWTYSVSTAHNDTYDLRIQETDAAGNVGAMKAYLPGAGDAVIHLGAGNGQLIAPVQVDGGQWFYHWDRNSDGSSAGDEVPRYALNATFKYSIDGVAGTGTTDTYRYATLNGVLLALPTLGVSSSELTAWLATKSQNERNDTSWYHMVLPATAAGSATSGTGDTTLNPAYDGLLAIWDAFNGTATTGLTGSGDGVNATSGVPPGWAPPWSEYASATPDPRDATRHYTLPLGGGWLQSQYDGMDQDGYRNSFHVALQAFKPLIAIDTLAPSVSTVTESTTAAITKDAISFTVTFSEALTGTVGPGNFTATNGSVTSVTQVGASNTYTVLVSPTAGLASGTVALNLVGTGLADAAGNALANADLSGLASQAIDTQAPVVSSVTETTTADTTRDPIAFTVSFSETLTGTLGPSNFTATDGTITSVTQADGTNAYTVVVTPTAGLSSGTVALSLVGTGLSDAAGHALADANLSSMASQAIGPLSPIDLGYYGKLIKPVTVDGGKTYYFWDRWNVSSADINDLTGADLFTSTPYFNSFFRYDASGAANPGSEATATYRFASINGVWMALPTVGGPSSPTPTAVGNSDQTVGSTASNFSYDDYLAIWDAYNGTGTTAEASNLNGTPPGWATGGYWAADVESNGRKFVSLNSGGVSLNTSGSYPDGFKYAAVEVLSINAMSSRENSGLTLVVDGSSLSSPSHYVGTQEADRLTGGAGDDVLWGGPGDDRLIGGGGKDRFVFWIGDCVSPALWPNDAPSSVNLSAGFDWIQDFGNGDSVELSHFNGYTKDTGSPALADRTYTVLRGQFNADTRIFSFDTLGQAALVIYDGNPSDDPDGLSAQFSSIVLTTSSGVGVPKLDTSVQGLIRGDSTAAALGNTAPVVNLGTALAGSAGNSVGETLTLTLSFDGPVIGLSSGSDSTIFKVGSTGVNASWSGTGNTRSLTYTILAGHNGQAIIDEAALKDALIASITDAAGNAFAHDGDIASIDATPLPVIDTMTPSSPTLVLGAGVSDGATRIEAAQSTGVVTLRAETGIRTEVTFTNGSNTVKTQVTGAGDSDVPVVLSAEDVETLGEGTVTVSAVAIDAAGNVSAAGESTFTRSPSQSSVTFAFSDTVVMSGASELEGVSIANKGTTLKYEFKGSGAIDSLDKDDFEVLNGQVIGVYPDPGFIPSENQRLDAVLSNGLVIFKPKMQMFKAGGSTSNSYTLLTPSGIVYEGYDNISMKGTLPDGSVVISFGKYDFETWNETTDIKFFNSEGLEIIKNAYEDLTFINLWSVTVLDNGAVIFKSGQDDIIYDAVGERSTGTSIDSYPLPGGLELINISTDALDESGDVIYDDDGYEQRTGAVKFFDGTGRFIAEGSSTPPYGGHDFTGAIVDRVYDNGVITYYEHKNTSAPTGFYVVDSKGQATAFSGPYSEYGVSNYELPFGQLLNIQKRDEDTKRDVYTSIFFDGNGEIVEGPYDGHDFQDAYIWKVYSNGVIIYQRSDDEAEGGSRIVVVGPKGDYVEYSYNQYWLTNLNSYEGEPGGTFVVALEDRIAEAIEYDIFDAEGVLTISGKYVLQSGEVFKEFFNGSWLLEESDGSQYLRGPEGTRGEITGSVTSSDYISQDFYGYEKYIDNGTFIVTDNELSSNQQKIYGSDGTALSEYFTNSSVYTEVEGLPQGGMLLRLQVNDPAGGNNVGRQFLVLDAQGAVVHNIYFAPPEPKSLVYVKEIRNNGLIFEGYSPTGEWIYSLVNADGDILWTGFESYFDAPNGQLIIYEDAKYSILNAYGGVLLEGIDDFHEGSNGQVIIYKDNQYGIWEGANLTPVSFGTPDPSRWFVEVSPNDGVEDNIALRLKTDATIVDEDGAPLNISAGLPAPLVPVDTLGPNSPTVLLGPDVAGDVSREEAAKATGVVTVMAETGASVEVTFSKDGSEVFSKTVTGKGSAPVAVVLSADQAITLGYGAVEVSAVATDAVGNESNAGEFTLTMQLPNYAPVFETTGLVAYWKMDEGTGTVAVDSGPYELNASLESGAAWANTGAPGFPTSKSVILNDDYLRVADNNLFNLSSGFTISAWALPSDNSNNVIIDRGENNLNFSIRPNDAVGLGFDANNKNEGGWLESKTPISPNVWVHVAVSWDPDTRAIKLYKDGALTDTFSNIQTPDFGTGELNIGRQNPTYSNTDYWGGLFPEAEMNGQLAEVAIFNRPLHVSEISSLMQKGLQTGVVPFPENGLGIAYQAKAFDANQDTVTYALAGTDAALFDINENTGEVTFNVAPDYEAPGDADNDNVYEITVTANDGVSTSDAQAVAITVTNVNEGPPVVDSTGPTLGESTSVVVTSFEESTLISTIALDIPDPSKAAITLDTVNDELDFGASDNTDMWSTRGAAPIAYLMSPQVALNGTWSIEARLRINDPSQNEQNAGLIFYADQDSDRPAFTFGMTGWNGDWRINIEDFNAGGRDDVSYSYDSAYLKVEITEKGASDDYRFFYKQNNADAWTQLGGSEHVFTSSADNARTGLWYKTGGGKPGAAFDEVKLAVNQPWTVASSTIAGSTGDSAGETITLTLSFDGNVNGLTSGTDDTIFKVGGSGVIASWAGTGSSRTLTYTIAAGQNGQAAIDETALKNALIAGITDAAGNAFAYSGNIPNIDASALPAVIDLGSHGKLIAPVQVDGGKWFYFWDRDGNGAADANDRMSHDVLDAVFVNDINGVASTGTTTSDTYRYATINGAALALPTAGRSNYSGLANNHTDHPGTSVGNSSDPSLGSNEINSTYNDFLAIWDAYNGTGSETTRLRMEPPGWIEGFYWLAGSHPTLENRHGYFSQFGGDIGFWPFGHPDVADNFDRGDFGFVALEVLSSDGALPVIDAIAPSASLTTAASPNTSNASVQSSETGTAYLVKTGGASPVSVTTLASITGAAGTKWNSAAISAANSPTALSLAGLEDGSYSLYTVDAAGNLSAAASSTYTIASPAPTLGSPAPALALGTAVSGAAGNSTGETITLTLNFDGPVNGLSSGSNKTIFKVGGYAVNATWSGSDSTRSLTYTIANGHNGHTTIDEVALKATLIAGITDAAGNGFAHDGTIAEIDSSALPVVQTPLERIQYATSVTASSGFNDSGQGYGALIDGGYDPSADPRLIRHSKEQVLGPPDSGDTADGRGWAALTANNPNDEWIEVHFPDPAYAESVWVRQMPVGAPNGFVSQIELIDVDGNYHTVFQGADPHVFSASQAINSRFDFPRTGYLVKGAKVHIETSGRHWEIVDSIALVGFNSPSFDAAQDFMAGPSAQSAGNHWQYFSADYASSNISNLQLLSNWDTDGNGLIGLNQWDANGADGDYPFVQQQSNGKLIVHPDSADADGTGKAVVVAWKNTTASNMTVDLTGGLSLVGDTLASFGAGSQTASDDGITYLVTTSASVGSTPNVLFQGSLDENSGTTAPSSTTLFLGGQVLAPGAMISVAVHRGNTYFWDHTQLDLQITPRPATIDLGSYGQLIAPVQVEGKWYYHWDRNGDGTSAGDGYNKDLASSYPLSEIYGLFKQDINGVAGAATDETYRYAVINGVKLALPELGGTAISRSLYGTSVSGTQFTNGDYDGLAAIWDAHNGEEMGSYFGKGLGDTVTSSNGYDSGAPPGWVNGSYVSATPLGGEFAYIRIYDGLIEPHANWAMNVALQVL